MCDTTTITTPRDSRRSQNSRIISFFSSYVPLLEMKVSKKSRDVRGNLTSVWTIAEGLPRVNSLG